MAAPPPDPVLADAVAIVTGGARGPGRELAHGLAGHGVAVVVVHLHDGRDADAIVEAILAARGAALAMRADVGDPVDVERVFDETGLTFGEVDVVVHTAGHGAAVVVREAARRLRAGGVVVTVRGAEDLPPALAGELGARGVTLHLVAPRLGAADREDAVAGLLAALRRGRRRPVA
jgi:SAM-dependent methyltransferase